VGEDDYSNANK